MDTGGLPTLTQDDLVVRTLGERSFPSPLDGGLLERGESLHYVTEDDRVLVDSSLSRAVRRGVPVEQLPSFEPGGPRRTLFFDPARTRVGIVTCGGLCPGLNNVIRGLVVELYEHYGVRYVLGFRNGYHGLTADGEEPEVLTPTSVQWINSQGGTVLGTSRGSQDPAVMVETLRLRRIDVLFVIGGDGSLRGAQAIADEAEARGLPLAVVGVPKTIDNDIPWIDRSFGFQTAFGRAAESIRSAHTEARSTRNGVGLIKLMGRHSGFIACYATLASDDADLVLIPEVAMPLEGERGVLAHIERVLDTQGHAVVVVAEGAGQDLFAASTAADASGNAKLHDIGALLRDRVTAHLAASGREFSLRYVDPGYAIRSVPANAHDSVYCTRLAQAAVHAAMAGRTSIVAGRWHGRFVHLPIPLVTASRNQVDSKGDLWLSVLEATGQPVFV
ncbi:ATP-dependent 6-phosphofructokinase [Modestobacter sp. I12A-02628]|uniref:ATP-dependent 6-phosphofructokinase n=1 Tax=Goekera deserti TaxID=2497753 RepID=A0A7K3WL65_9ACTN|nr:ATP-dependent 6-phosphofructokinase [Goekera deserti]MPQ99990.1 ATP-dependent 6-phosphofructokinase [Goekera deserti]NDI49769.1 ATP-dependent 6-phosphofructokinase [Goekera deserti]NEL56619.1 ATP-dependent 6-phosphofructokinase [Goekera deserti]